MSKFICPVCGERLEITGRSYVCLNRHSFDIAKSGYVNLLLSKHAGKTVHGDNKLMVSARRSFLDKGYYAPLKDALCEKICRYFPNGGVLVDAGCGEGYYTDAAAQALEKDGKSAEIYGIDISKTAVEFSAKRCKEAVFATASVFHIPLGDSSCDMVISLFSPYCGEEFRRVLKSNGVMILAIPSENHLWELKQAIYDTPYKNQVKPYELDGFAFIGKKKISRRIALENAEDIQSLFSMTPYYYRTGRTELERLAALEKLETQTEFELLIYRNIK